MRITLHRQPRRRPLRWLILALLTLLSCGAWATDTNSPDTASAADAPAISSPAAAPVEQPKQCYSGCQSWGQMCNVDPRGVYKCQRSGRRRGWR